LELDCLAPYRPKEQDAFVILVADKGFAGGFGNIVCDMTCGIPPGMAPFTVEAVGTTCTGTFNGYTAGDANGDHKASLGDLCIMAGNWKQSGKGWADGDFNGEGRVSIGDLSLLAGNWGWELPSGGPVPEPGTAALVVLGAGAVLSRRRRRPAA